MFDNSDPRSGVRLNRQLIEVKTATSAIFACAALAPALVATAGFTKNSPDGVDTEVYPMVRFISAGAPDRVGRTDQLTPMDLADLYTSLKITPSGQIAGPHDLNEKSNAFAPERSYDKERPSWLVRLFGTRTINIAAVANVQISDPDLPISAPLFSIQHQTLHGAPDEYVSNYTSSHSATPLFRIGASSVFTLHVHEAISNNQTFSGVSTLIKAVETATTIAAPHAALLTSLSSQDVSNASQAIDTAIGGILSSQQTEDIELAHDISLTFADRSGRPSVYSIVARVPSSSVKFSYELTSGQVANGTPDYDNQAKPAPIIGHWYVWLTCPRPSVFSAEDICQSLEAPAAISAPALDADDAVRTLPGALSTNVALPATIATARTDSVNNAYPSVLSTVVTSVQNAVVARLAGRPSQVLSTKLSSQVTIEDFVTASDPYKSFFANPNRQPADTRKFCADVIDLLYKQGLSHFDARLVLWAMTRGLSDIIRADAPATPTAGEVAVDIPSNCYDLVNPDPTGPNIPLNMTWGAKNPSRPFQPAGQ